MAEVEAMKLELKFQPGLVAARELLLQTRGGRRTARPTCESMIEGGRLFISEQPRNLRDRYARVVDVLEREAAAQLIDDLRISRALVGQPSHERSLAESERFCDRPSADLTVRQQLLHLVLNGGV
jgi:hypothetical protein